MGWPSSCQPLDGSLDRDLDEVRNLEVALLALEIEQDAFGVEQLAEGLLRLAIDLVLDEQLGLVSQDELDQCELVPDRLVEVGRDELVVHPMRDDAKLLVAEVVEAQARDEPG